MDSGALQKQVVFLSKLYVVTVYMGVRCIGFGQVRLWLLGALFIIWLPMPAESVNYRILPEDLLGHWHKLPEYGHIPTQRSLTFKKPYTPKPYLWPKKLTLLRNCI